jgi:hypothetical protein
MANVEHNTLTEPDLHEVKGAASASNGTVLVASGNGTATFQALDTLSKLGSYDYGDTATTGSPIAVPNGSFVDLTNNGLSPNSDTTYALTAAPDLWNVSTSRFDFTKLNLGAVVHVRIDVDITTTGANTEVDLILELGLGVTPYSIGLSREFFKSAGVHKVVSTGFVQIRNDLTRDNPARIKASSGSSGTTLVVNGWAITAQER